MSLDNRKREQMLAHCGAIHEDDGVDPRDYFKSSRGLRKPDHKAWQLCRQVAQTLDQVLSGELGDDGLCDLRVASVQPAPDASRLLVTVVADDLAAPFRRDLLASRLQRAAGRLRTEVAAAITRRRAPVLTFAVLGGEAGHGGDAA